MGKNNNREYRVWDAAEEAALKAGVKKHGLGAWERIRTDAEFSILLHRTGVQLKDKWRNLVKFRHITPDETLSLQPKTSGPWHKKYTTAQAASQRVVTVCGMDGPSAKFQQPVSGRPPARSRKHLPAADEPETDEDAVGALEDLPPRKSSRAAKRRMFDELEEGLAGDEDDNSWEVEYDTEGRSSGSGTRRRRQVTCDMVAAGGSGMNAEDRRFGIYDRRRYDSLDPGAEQDAVTAAVAGAAGMLDFAAAGIRPRGRGGSSMGSRQRGHNHIRGPESGSSSDATEYEDSYIVDCPCGIKYDDGHLMIECEHCKAWAHTACLQAQMEMDPVHTRYDFMHYVCMRCQMHQQQDQHQQQHQHQQQQLEQQLQLPQWLRGHRQQQPPTQASVDTTAAAAAAAAAHAAANAAAAAAVQDAGMGPSLPPDLAINALLGLLDPTNALQGAASRTPASGLGGAQQPGRFTPPMLPGSAANSLLQHSWLLQGAAGLLGGLQDQGAAAQQALSQQGRAADAGDNANRQNPSLGQLGGSNGALAAAEGLAHLSAGLTAGADSGAADHQAGPIGPGNSSNAAAQLLTATAAAKGCGHKSHPAEVHLGAGDSKDGPPGPFFGASSEEQQTWSALQQLLRSTAAAGSSGLHQAPNAGTAGHNADAVECAAANGVGGLNPLLLQYLQESVQINTKHQAASKGPEGSGRGFVEWAQLQQRQQAEEDSVAAAAAKDSAGETGDRPADIQHSAQPGSTGAASNSKMPSQPVCSAGPAQVSQQQSSPSVVRRTVARKQRSILSRPQQQLNNQQQQQLNNQQQQQQQQQGRVDGHTLKRDSQHEQQLWSGLWKALGLQQPQQEQQQEHQQQHAALQSKVQQAFSDVTAAAENGSQTVGKWADSRMYKLLMQNQHELEQMFIKGTAAQDANSAEHQQPQQQQQQRPVKQQQQQLDAAHQAGIPGWLLRHAAENRAGATASSEGGSSASDHAVAGPRSARGSGTEQELIHRASADSPNPLVHLLSHGPLGSALGSLYPAVLGGLAATGTPPPGSDILRPASAAGAVALAAAAAATAAVTPGFNHAFAGPSSSMAGPAVQQEPRPLTPVGLADYAALFRKASPELAATLSDLHGGGNWPSRTPPLSELLQAGLLAPASTPISTTDASLAVDSAGPDDGLLAKGGAGVKQQAHLAVDHQAIATPAAAAAATITVATAAAGAVSAGLAPAHEVFLNLNEPMQQQSRSGVAASIPSRKAYSAGVGHSSGMPDPKGALQQVLGRSTQEVLMQQRPPAAVLVANDMQADMHYRLHRDRLTSDTGGLDLLAGAVVAEENQFGGL